MSTPKKKLVIRKRNQPKETKEEDKKEDLSSEEEIKGPMQLAFDFGFFDKDDDFLK